jgi:hypothetical protein
MAAADGDLPQAEYRVACSGLQPRDHTGQQAPGSRKSHSVRQFRSDNTNRLARINYNHVGRFAFL